MKVYQVIKKVLKKRFPDVTKHWKLKEYWWGTTKEELIEIALKSQNNLIDRRIKAYKNLVSQEHMSIYLPDEIEFLQYIKKENNKVIKNLKNE